MKLFDPHSVRSQFPALNQKIDGVPPIFFDGPGGTQVPQSVLDAMAEYLGGYNSNLLNSPFFAVQRTHEVLAKARQNAATFVNAPNPNEIVFGASMSAVTAHLSRSLSHEWGEGDEIILSELDHYSNVSFWEREARERGATVHKIPVCAEDCTLDTDALYKILSPKTKFVAFTLASNICGSYTPAKEIIETIRKSEAAQALVFIDSVHAAPHRVPDVQDLGCDFLACSAYKFYGPHYGFVCGKSQHWERLIPYKVEPASDVPPESWEMGTKSFEALAGFNAVIDYLASLGEGRDLRSRLQSFYQCLSAYENQWSKEFLVRSEVINGMQIWGVKGSNEVHLRTPTFAFTIEGKHSQAVAEHLARHQISCGAGNFYAKGVVDALKLEGQGGVVRAGCVHYNTMEELDRFFNVLELL